MNALVVEELPEVDDRRWPVAGEERGQALGISFVRDPLVRIFGIRRIPTSLVEQTRESLLARPRAPFVDVDPGRDLMDAVDMAADLLQHIADVTRADDDSCSARQDVSPPLFELGTAAHRILELGAVRLHHIAASHSGADGSPEEDVVAEHDVGRQLGTDCCGVRLDPRVQLTARAVLEQLHLVALVAVEHEDR